MSKCEGCGSKKVRDFGPWGVLCPACSDERGLDYYMGNDIKTIKGIIMKIHKEIEAMFQERPGATVAVIIFGMLAGSLLC